jgi:hypothetical protein
VQGRGLTSTQPDADGCQLDEGAVAGCEFVVAGVDTPTLLDPVEKSLDETTRAIKLRAQPAEAYRGSRAWEWIRDGASSLQPLVVLLVYYAGRFQAHRRRWVSTSQRNRLAIAMICACALGGCAKSKEDAQIELIECAAFKSEIPQSLLETIYTELRNIGIQPVAIQQIPTLANAFTVKFDRTVVSARWNKGVTAGKESVEKRDVAGIAKYLKSCVGTMNDALRD